MTSIATLKHLIHKYYPRNHLLLASILSAGLIALVLFSTDDQAHGNLIQTDLTLPADLDAEFSIEQEALTPDATIANASPLVDPMAEDLRAGWTDVEVSPGDNLSTLFTQVGLSARDLHRVLDSSDDTSILDRLHPGYQLAFYMPEPGELKELQVLTSPLDGYTFTLQDARYEVEPIVREAEHVEAFRSGEIADSLFMAAQRADIPAHVIMEMADIFGGVIDFILDPRRGDEFSILYEETWLDGERVRSGSVIGARFINRDREHIALRYETEAGDVGYFTPDGESMRKAFLRNPLDVFRISSNFNPNRRHPIHNTIRAHRGTDYAAPTGTPVRATADGQVTWAARNGSFGKLVVVKHPGGFETKYAHLNGYASDVRNGVRVRQGQVIGYVGATGGATGPHLHYEFLVNGTHRDPRTVLDELPQAVSLEAAEMPRFHEHTREALARLTDQVTEQRLLSYNADNTGSTTH